MSEQKRTENNAPTPPTKITLEKLKSSLGLFVYIKPYIWHFIGGLILLSASSIIFMIFPKAAGEMANTANGKANWHFSVQEYGLIFLVILIIQGVISYLRLFQSEAWQILDKIYTIKSSVRQWRFSKRDV